MTLTIEFPEQLNAELEVIPKTGYCTSTSEFLKDAMKTILAASSISTLIGPTIIKWLGS